MADLFLRRAKTVLATLLSAGNESTPTLVASIDDPVIQDEDPENIDGMLQIMREQGHIGYVNDGSGNLSFVLKPSGVALAATLQGRK